jgi:nucleoside-diphosphate-sugar epimerase
MDGSSADSSPAFPSLKAMRVCVTGGAGFIGSNVAAELLRQGAEVCILDDLSTGDGVRIDRLFALAQDRLDFIHGSILDPAALNDAIEGADAVLHLAAVASVQASMDNPRRTFDVNAAGTMRVAEACRQAGVKRLVYAASASAYGDSPTPHRESAHPRPLSPYAASKVAGELVVSAWASSMGVDGVALRLFNVFGAGQPADSAYAAVVPAFISHIRQGKAPVIYGDGAQTRDFICIGEVVRAFLMAAVSAEPLKGEVVNIGSGDLVTVLELAETLLRIAGRDDLRPRHEAARAGDVRDSVADMTKAYAVLGFKPDCDLERSMASILHAGADAPASAPETTA